MYFFSSRRRHTRLQGDWSSDVCSSDLELVGTFMDVTARGYRAAMTDPTAAADALLGAAPELDEDLVRRSAEYLSSRYRSEERRVGKECRSRWLKMHV